MDACKQLDRSMIAHVRDECMRRILFFSDIIFSGQYLGIVTMASAVRNFAVLGNPNCTCHVPC